MTCSSDAICTLYSVTHLARARAFYEGLLELQPVAAYERGGLTRIEYELNPGTLVITDSPGVPANRSEAEQAVVITVADFDAIIADLRDARVGFVTEPGSDPAWFGAVVCDPDSNRVALCPRVNA